MATNVTYKNNSLTSFNSGTKILKTTGKYMEDDVTVTTSAGSATTPATTITANPTISVNSSGLITATTSATQNITPTVSAGYVGAGTAGTVTVSGSKTQQLTTKAAATITPTTTNQTIASGTYLTGTQTITGDADLVASNIKAGVNIFNVNGTFTSDATATANQIIKGYTAYVNGNLITGTASDIDVPMFTITWKDDWSEVKTVTCDKTYAEIGQYTAAIVTLTDESHTREFTAPAEHVGSTQNPYYFTLIGDGVPAGDIVYYADSIGYNETSINIENQYITGNGDYYPTKYAPRITVNVPSSSPTLQTKTATYTPTESQQTATITADSGYDGLSSVGVTVNAVSSTYVGTGITRRSSANLTVSGATVTAPAGYYSAQVSKSVASGTATPAATISGTAATVSTGTNTITLTKSISNTPTVSAGYITAGTAGNSSVSLTASVTTKAAATITPTTTNQTIAAGTYLTGTQTIAGDADLVASNIISTANIFGVQGSVVIQNYYTGLTTPSNSLGNNGDLYLQTED